MTREEELYEQSKKYLHDAMREDEFGASGDLDEIKQAFQSGAEWADSHPLTPWRSVKEELPECEIEEEWGEASKTVLFVDVMGDYYIGQYCIEHNEDGTDDTYWWDINPDSSIVTNVTHWFPIPELPKEKEDAE